MKNLQNNSTQSNMEISLLMIFFTMSMSMTVSVLSCQFYWQTHKLSIKKLAVVIHVGQKAT